MEWWSILLVAAAISGNTVVKGLDVNSTQADKAVMKALIACGADMCVDNNEIAFGKATALKPFSFDATDCPDLFPPLAVLAAYCEGTTVIRGVLRLAHKESDRGLTIQEELGKMGLQVELKADEMHIHGGNGLKGANTHSRHDHRIAMMCAIAALKAQGETVIEEAQAVAKSYPNFYGHIQSLGAIVSLNNKETIHE